MYRAVYQLVVQYENGDCADMHLCQPCIHSVADFLRIAKRSTGGLRCDRCGAVSRKKKSRAELDALVRERAGCEALRYTRASVLVGLYRSAESGMEEDDELPWTTVCEDHSTLVSHPSKRLAVAHLGHPDGWCDECRALKS